jgi:hypothetical protein
MNWHNFQLRATCFRCPSRNLSSLAIAQKYPFKNTCDYQTKCLRLLNNKWRGETAALGLLWISKNGPSSGGIANMYRSAGLWASRSRMAGKDADGSNKENRLLHLWRLSGEVSLQFHVCWHGSERRSRRLIWSTDAINSVSSLPSPATFYWKSRKNSPHGYFNISGAVKCSFFKGGVLLDNFKKKDKLQHPSQHQLVNKHSRDNNSVSYLTVRKPESSGCIFFKSWNRGVALNMAKHLEDLPEILTEFFSLPNEIHSRTFSNTFSAPLNGYFVFA